MKHAIDSLPLKKPTKEYIFHILDSQPVLFVWNKKPFLSDNQYKKHRNALPRVIYEFILRGYSTDAIFGLFWESFFEEEHWNELSNRMDLLTIIIGLVSKIDQLNDDIEGLKWRIKNDD